MAADPLAGTAYRTLRPLGSGAMGRVLLAEHVALARRVAVKVLLPQHAGDPALVDRMRLEAQALAAVRHANVVVVHDHGVTADGLPFLVMEYLEGRTLAEILLERGDIPLPEAMSWLDQVFSGIAAIHAAGLVHRDLKPANVFVSEERGRAVLKILDLGIVKIADSSQAPSIAPLRYPTRDTHAIGTPRCMAPEQILGRPCDARTDVYAAGVLLYLLLAGKDPFHHHRTELAILTAHVSERPPRLSAVASQHVPRAVDEAAARALEKDPARRFSSIFELGAALSPSGGTVRMRPVLSGPTEKIAVLGHTGPKTARLPGPPGKPAPPAVSPGAPFGAPNGAPARTERLPVKASPAVHTGGSLHASRMDSPQPRASSTPEPRSADRAGTPPPRRKLPDPVELATMSHSGGPGAQSITRGVLLVALSVLVLGVIFVVAGKALISW